MRKLFSTPITAAVLIVAAVLLALPFLASVMDQPFYITLSPRILIYALAAVSLDLILGYGGMVSLGHAAFMGTGAYTVGILAFHSTEGSALFSWPFAFPGIEEALLAWPLAVLSAALIALVIGAVSLRTRGVYFIMITLAFSQMIYFFFVSLEKYGGDDGLSLFSRSRLAGLDLNNDIFFYYICLFILMGFVALSHRLVNARFGMVIRGCKENEARMAALGVSVYGYKLACFTIAGAGAGLAGALLANQTGFISPGLMHWKISGEILVMVVLGGMGTLAGPVLGAALLLLLEEFFSLYTEHWMLILGLVLIAVVRFARRGLLGALPSREAANG